MVKPSYDLVAYCGHEWRQYMPPGRGYVCENCGATCRDAEEMKKLAGTCRIRWAPRSWLPLKDQKG